MIGLPYDLYAECILSEKAQRYCASILIEEVKVLSSLNDLSVVGMLGSGEVLAREIARLLKKPYCVLPVAPLVAENGHKTIYGAMSGMNDVLNIEPTVLNGASHDEIIQSLSRAKRTLLHEIQNQEACSAWTDSKDSLRGTTILLVDATMISKVKFRTALESLHRDGFTSIIPLAAFLNKEVVLGNTYPLKKGVFLKTFDNIEELRQEVQAINRLGTDELETLSPFPNRQSLNVC